MKNKTRGAVTIFLVVILVPCILVSSIFVDVSRVKLAQGAAESAADLALNTLLSQFDTDLNDWYGLVASCQNVEEFYEVSAQQFYKIVSSQGVTAEEAGLAADTYNEVMGDDSIYNFIRVESLNQSVSAVPNANLKDPMIIKEQVVEFMKYRAPIEMTLGLLNRLKKTHDEDAAAIEEADANEELVEAKQEYYNAESGWLRNAFATYQALMVYYQNIDQDTYYDSAVSLPLTTLENWAEFIDETRGTYETIHQLLILNLFTANNPETGYKVSTPGMVPSNWELELTDSTQQEAIDAAKLTILAELKEEGFVRCDAAAGTEPTLADYSICSPDSIETLYEGAEGAVSNFKTALTKIKSDTEELINKYKAEGSTMTPVQVWVALSKKVTTTDIFNKWSTVLRNYKYLMAVKDLDVHTEGCTDAELPQWCGVDTQGKLNWHAMLDVNGLLLIMEKLGKACFSNEDSGIAEADYYKYLRETLQNLSANNSNKVDPDTATVMYGDTTKSVSYVLDNTKTVLSKYHEILTARIEELDKILGGEEGTDNIGLDKLEESAAALYEAYNKWNETVENTNTNMAEEDQQELNSGYTVQGENGEPISYQSVKDFVELINDPGKYSELRDRLNNIKAQFQSIVTALETLTVYGGTPIMEIGDYATLRKLAAENGIEESKISLYNAANDEYAEKSFKEIFTEAKSEKTRIISVHDSLASDAYKYQPQMYPDSPRCNDSGIQTPELFVMLHERWKGAINPTPEEQAEAQDTETQINQAQEQAEGNSSENPDESVEETPDGVGGDITATIADGEGFSAFDTLTGLWGILKNLFGGNMDEIRDDIYITTYMMEMFSYATFANEGKFNLLTSSLQDSINTMNYTGPGYYGNAKLIEKWESTALTVGRNKSLTGKMINSANNHAYLAELEYILYGKTTSKANISAAKTSIFGIRYLLNTISCFQHHWRNAVISSAATALSAATWGIIPAPLIKAVILLLYAAAETGVDLKRLSCGFKVALYKGKDDWAITINPANIFEMATGGTFDSDKNGLFYSDYMLLFVFSGLSKGGNMERSMLLRMAEVIQANMRKLPGNASFDLGKSHTYFKLEATLRVKPMMVALPIFEDYDRDGMLVATDWCTFDVSMVRGYS